MNLYTEVSKVSADENGEINYTYMLILLFIQNLNIDHKTTQKLYILKSNLKWLLNKNI